MRQILRGHKQAKFVDVNDIGKPDLSKEMASLEVSDAFLLRKRIKLSGGFDEHLKLFGVRIDERLSFVLKGPDNHGFVAWHRVDEPPRTCNSEPRELLDPARPTNAGFVQPWRSWRLT